MIPVLPKLVVRFEAGDVGRAAEVTGVFGFAWAAMQFVFSPVLGAMSDRFGRRPIILLSNVGLGLDYVVMALAPSLGWLFVGRLISGITAASYPTASAYVADVTPPEQRAARFGMLGAAFGLGFVVGPAVGGFLGSIDLRLPFWVAALLSLANAAYGFFILPESLPPERRSVFSWRGANPLGSLRLLRSFPALSGMAMATFVFFIAQEALPSTFVLYADYRYGWSEQQVGLVLCIVGVCATVVSALLVGRAVRWLGERGALLVGLMAAVAGYVVYGLAPTGMLFLMGIPLVAIWGIAGAAAQALMSRQVGPNAQGQLQGALSSLRGVSGMMGPLLFTQVFSWAIGPAASIRLPGAPYLLGAVLLAGSLLVSWYVTRPHAAPLAPESAAP
ncbi:tetracycline resistance MFS efflux pump [Corallococcus sp. H22C18031201]|nr:tetracycline resistance MFS efflux pump [Corallococcus sp. H22C18031201]